MGDTETTILQNVDLDIRQGEFLSILGVSGSGKSTLLNLIGALDTPTSGEVKVLGENLSRATEEERTLFRRHHLGFIFQFYNLLPTMTAEENVKLGLELLKLPAAEMQQRVSKYLEAVGLGTKKHKFPSQMSGGEQQRVAIARALVKQPRIILADEPTGNLDRETAHSILALMRRMNQDSGVTFIIVTHDMEVAKLSDRVYRVGGMPPAQGAVQETRSAS
jgi:ABC-type lipoprotein export system ATPase subunit